MTARCRAIYIVIDKGNITTIVVAVSVGGAIAVGSNSATSVGVLLEMARWAFTAVQVVVAVGIVFILTAAWAKIVLEKAEMGMLSDPVKSA